MAFITIDCERGGEPLPFYLLSSVFIALYIAINYYIGLRGRQLFVTRLHLLNVQIYWCIFFLIVFVSILGVIGHRFLPRILQGIFSCIANYWLPAVVYFFLFIVLIDLVRVLGSPFGLTEAIKNHFIFTSALGLVVVLFVAGLLTYGTWNARNIKITSYQIHIAKLAGALKKLHIVMISDLHLSDIGERRSLQIIDKVNRLKPDLIVIPGDIVPIEKLRMAENLRKLKSKYGVFASLGNHDYYEGDLSQRIHWLQQAGIDVLRDNDVKVAESFYLIGRDDKSYEMMSGTQRKKIAELTAGINHELPLIELDHQPVDLEAAREAGIDLQLSGHTHKGQFFPFNLVTSRVFKIDYGYLKMGSLQVIVSSGAGTWGPPIRIGSSSEVVDIQLTFQ
jgi:Predicted phosphohydrolases